MNVIFPKKQFNVYDQYYIQNGNSPPKINPESLSYSFFKSKIKDKKDVNHPIEIKKHLFRFIQEKERKYYGLKNRLLRTCAFVIAFVSSFFFGFGMTLYKKLKKDHSAFESEIDRLRKMAEGGEDELLAALNRIKIEELIGQQIRHIPTILKEIEEQLPIDEQQQHLQERLIKDYPTDKHVSYVRQFDVDMTRGITFRRHDAYKNIEDNEPQPSTDIVLEEKTKVGLSLLNELITTDEEKAWVIALQLLANQTTINHLFDVPILLFNLNAANHQWEDPISGSRMVLRAEFPHNLPTIDLKMIRDPITHTIEEINVEMKGSLDIIANTTQHPSQEKKWIQKEAIRGQLSYSIKLNEQKHPIVNKFSAKLEANPGS
ncbi:MAG: hypothetical protein ACH350_03420 [Parachlamydiaceae bacterium]